MARGARAKAFPLGEAKGRPGGCCNSCIRIKALPGLELPSNASCQDSYRKRTLGQVENWENYYSELMLWAGRMFYIGDRDFPYLDVWRSYLKTLGGAHPSGPAVSGGLNTTIVRAYFD